MKKLSKTESKIRQAIPEIDVDEDLQSLSQDLDRLEIWVDFKNSPVGREFIGEIENMCAKRINVLLKEHRSIGDKMHDFLAEINVLTTIIERVNKAEAQYPELQDEIDRRVETLASLIKKSSNASNSGL